MNTSVISTEPRAQAIEFVRNYELYGDGYAIHWPTLDEDIAIPGLLGLPD